MDGNGQEIVELGYNTDISYKLTPEYVAGFFDGEGCIRILGGNKTNYVGIQVFITNTYKPVLNILKEKYGGSVLLRTEGNIKHKTCYQWRITGKKEIKLFINDILDFSVEKKPQLLLGLEYCNLPTLTVNRYSKFYDKVLNLQNRRKEIALEMKILKRINH